jgi:hypothetical protein
MPRIKLSLPHERRKMALQSQKLRSRVRIAEEKQRLEQINAELSAMKPAARTNRSI